MNTFNQEQKQMTTAAQKKAEEEIYKMAVTAVRTRQRVGTSFVQRKLRIGSNRAVRLIERMEEEGVVSKIQNHGSRNVLGT
jgi:DNA segregation ATPase FtsK/SpoIIIE-like protein